MSKQARQYTIRNIPDRIDRILRRRARDTAKSFNQIALEALTIGAGEPLKPKRDFSEIIGSLTEFEAHALEEEIHHQHQIDPEMWRK